MKIILPIVQALATLAIVYCGCEQSLTNQLDNQNIIYDCNKDQGTINVNGNPNGNDLVLDLLLISLDSSPNSYIIFIGFKSITFNNLKMVNNINVVDQYMEGLVVLQDCYSVSIGQLTIQQDNKFPFYGSHLTINKIQSTQNSNDLSILNALIVYCQPYYQVNWQSYILNLFADQIQLQNFVVNLEFSESIFTSAGLVNTASQTLQPSFFSLTNLQLTFKILMLQDTNLDMNIVSFIGFQTLQAKDTQLKDINIQITADRFYPLVMSPLFLISSDTSSIEDITFSILNIAAYPILFLQNLEHLNLANISFQNSIVQNQPNFWQNSQEQNSYLIKVKDTTNISIQNINIINVDCSNIIFLYLSNIQNLDVTSINIYSDISIQDDSQTVCQDTQIELSWVDTIFYFDVENTRINDLNIKGLNYQGISTGILEFNNVATLSLSNSKLLLDSSVSMQTSNGYFLNILSNSLSTLTLDGVEVTFNSTSSQMSLLNSSVFRFQFISNINNPTINLNKFTLQNLNSPQKAFIDSLQGSIFNIGGSGTNIKVIMTNCKASGIRSSGQGGLMQISNGYSLTIKDSEFQSISSGGNGGVFNLQNINTLSIMNTLFVECHSDYFGGVIYFQQSLQPSITFSNVNAINNTALVGAVFVGPSILDNISGISYTNNRAGLSGNNYSPNIASMNVTGIYEYNPQFDDENLRLIENTNFDVSIINFEQTILNVNQIQSGFSYVVEIQFALNKNNILSLNSNSGNQGISQYFSLNNLLQQQGNSANYLQMFEGIESFDSFYILIESPQLDKNTPFQFSLCLNDLILNIQLTEMDGCMDGQIKTNGNCQFCDNFSYTNPEQTECIQCDPTYYQSCYSNQTVLNQGFIRQLSNSINDSLIESCTFIPSNCKGGRGFGNENCENYHVGPQCLDCDIQNIRGTGHTARQNSFLCSPCNGSSFNYAMVSLSIIVGIIFILVLYKIIMNSVVESGQQTKMNKRSYNYEYNGEEGEIIIQKEGKQVNSLVYFKLILFYLAIIYPCSFYTNNSNVTISYLFNFQINLYNPFVGSYFTFLKCFLAQQFPDTFSTTHLMIIVLTLCPIIFFTTFLLIKFIYHTIYYLYKKKQYQNEQNQNYLGKYVYPIDEINNPRVEENRNSQPSFSMKFFNPKNYQYIGILLFFLYYSCGFQIFENLLSGTICLSFDNYGSVSLANMTLSCNDSTLLYWKQILFIPLLAILMLIQFSVIPILVFLQKKQNNTSLKILFSEYQDSYLWWEQVRNLFKGLIIAVIYGCTPSNNLIGYLIIFILGMYLFLLYKTQPYKNTQFNETEKKITWIGLILNILYIANTIFQFTGSDSSGFVQVLLFFGNLAAFICLTILFVKFAEHLL